MTKLTYVSAIESAINGNLTDEVVEKLTALKASLEKRNSRKSTKPTKAQRENENVKSDILAVLADGEGHQCKAIASELGFSGQKISALLKQLVDAELVEKYTDKRVTYFKVVEG